jgi:hypothetical protein
VTEVEICTAALGFLGTAGITSLEDDTDEARACKAFYSVTRDKVLEERIWTFAKTQYILAPVQSKPGFTWANRFLIPGEIVRIHRVDDGSGSFRVPYDILGKFICCDAEKLYVTAVRREVDTSLYSPAFTAALVLNLAATLSVPLTENRQLKADLIAEYQAAIKEASGLDGSQGPPEYPRVSNAWADRRR